MGGLLYIRPASQRKLKWSLVTAGEIVPRATKLGHRVLKPLQLLFKRRDYLLHTWVGQWCLRQCHRPTRTAEEQQKAWWAKTCVRTCITADGLLATLLEVEAFDSYWLLTISGPVDDGPTAPLAKDVTLLLGVLQLGSLQKQPSTHNPSTWAVIYYWNWNTDISGNF